MVNKSSNEDREWRMSVYENLVADRRVQAIAMQIAEASREPGDPEVNLGDTAAARRYLLRCVMRMSIAELANIDVATAGGLWGRGAIGAARWRARAKAPRQVPAASEPPRPKPRA